MKPCLVLLLLTAACGTPDPDVSADAAPDAKNHDAHVSDALWSIDAEDEPPTQDPTYSDASVIDGGGPFLCGGCECDGRTHYCTIFSGPPPMPTSGDAGDDAGSCVPKEGFSCVPLPSTCSVPSCTCFGPITTSCSCGLSENGEGIVYGCLGS